jgi:hypothetical protein
MLVSSSPYINRFLSADTTVLGYANPQALNRYSYTFNSPLNYIDPSGHDPWWCDSSSNPAACYAEYTTDENGVSGGTDNQGNDDHHNDGGDGQPLPTPTPTPSPTPAPTPTPAPGGANNYDCFTHPDACGTGTQTQSSSIQPNSSGTNWGQVATGIAIIVAVDLLIVAPIIVGAILSWKIVAPVLAEAALTETPWVMAMGAAIISVNAYAVHLIVEGAQEH